MELSDHAIYKAAPLGEIFAVECALDMASGATHDNGIAFQEAQQLLGCGMIGRKVITVHYACSIPGPFI